MSSYRPTNYNFPSAVRGDTFNGLKFTVLVNDIAVDLTNATIIMDLRLTPTGVVVKSFTTVGSGGITINSDPTTGKFVFDAQIIDLPAAKYVYDIEIDFQSGLIKTYIGGTWEIIQDVTYTTESI